MNNTRIQWCPIRISAHETPTLPGTAIGQTPSWVKKRQGSGRIQVNLWVQRVIVARPRPVVKSLENGLRLASSSSGPLLTTNTATIASSMATHIGSVRKLSQRRSLMTRHGTQDPKNLECIYTTLGEWLKPTNDS
jgi:hypothetical protein